MEQKLIPKKKSRNISYGILLFYQTSEGEVYVLIQQRRDSFAFIEIIQGKWNDDAHLKEKISNLTKSEQLRLLNFSYEELWFDINIDYKKKNSKTLISQCKENYSKNRKKILNYLTSVSVNKIHNSWELPKGRKKIKENSLTCAIREFQEETNISSLENIYLYKDYKIKNIFIGQDDNKEYTTIFYVAEIDHLPEKKFTIFNDRCIRTMSISAEVENIKWLTLSEAKLLIDSNYVSVLVNLENHFQYIKEKQKVKLSEIMSS